MKKVLLATLMVALMTTTVFHVNAVSVQKETEVDNNTDVDYESEGKSEIGASDEYNEIISFLTGGGARIIWEKKIGLKYYNLEFIGGGNADVKLIGITSFFPYKSYRAKPVHINIPYFIGLAYMAVEEYHMLHGIALGNIEWET